MAKGSDNSALAPAAALDLGGITFGGWANPGRRPRACAAPCWPTALGTRGPNLQFGSGYTRWVCGIESTLGPFPACVGPPTWSLRKNVSPSSSTVAFGTDAPSTAGRREQTPTTGAPKSRGTGYEMSTPTTRSLSQVGPLSVFGNMKVQKG